MRKTSFLKRVGWSLWLVCTCWAFFGGAICPALAGEEAEKVMLEESLALKGYQSGRSASSRRAGYRSPTINLVWMTRALPHVGEAAREKVRDWVEYKESGEGFTLNWRPLRASTSEAPLEKTVTTLHFTVTIHLTGSPDDDFVLQQAAAILEASYNKMVEGLRFKQPLLTQRYYKVVITALPGYYGVTYPQSCDPDACESYIEVDDDFDFVMTGDETPEERRQKLKENLEITLAHEMFHAIQFAHYGLLREKDERRIRMDGWAVEGSAVWMEEQVYPNSNDYASTYLPVFFSSPANSWTGPNLQNSTHIYGSMMYFKSLTERLPFGPLIVRDLFQTYFDKGYESIMYSLRAVLEPYGYTPLDVSHQLWVGAVSGEFADHAEYPPVGSYVTYTAPDRQDSIRVCGFCTYIFTLDTKDLKNPTDISFLVSANISSPVQASLVSIQSGGQAEYTRLLRDPAVMVPVYRGELSGIRAGSPDAVRLVVSTGEDAAGTMTVVIRNSTRAPVRKPQTISLKPGWNLVSSALVADDGDPGRWYNKGEQVLMAGFNGSSLTFFQPSESGFLGMDKPGRAYLINAPKARNVSITGIHDPTVSHSFYLKTGFNLVGNPFFNDVQMNSLVTLKDGRGRTMSLEEAVRNGLITRGLFALGENGSYTQRSDYGLASGESAWLLVRQGPLTIVWSPP